MEKGLAEFHFIVADYNLCFPSHGILYLSEREKIAIMLQKIYQQDKKLFSLAFFILET